MSGLKIEGYAGVVADVDADRQAMVTTNTDPLKAGAVVLFSECDAGSSAATRLLLSPETSDDYRLRVGIDTMLLSHTFNYAAQDTTLFRYDTSTLTTTWSGGFMTLNGANNTAAGSTAVRSYRTFPLFGAASTAVEFSMAFTATPPANFTADIGIAIAGTTAPFAPTDGVFLRFNNGGIFIISNFNGSEVASDALGAAASITIGKTRKYTLVISEDSITLWIDDVRAGTLETPDGIGQPMMSGSAGLFTRLVNAAITTAVQIKISDVTVSLMDYNTTVPSATQFSLMGGNASQGQSGGTLGTTAQYANSADPAAAAAISNATPQAVGFGGQTRILAPVTGTTDGILISYQNPAPAVGYTARPIAIYGVSIDAVNLVVAVATTATVLSLSLAYGHTAATFATTETATTKAPRRKALGFMTWPVGAVVGAPPTQSAIVRKFDAPIILQPGEFVAIVAKAVVGTATATQELRFLVDYDAAYLF